MRTPPFVTCSKNPASASAVFFEICSLGIFGSSVRRRARLLREVPDVAEKIESGAVNLSQLSKVQQAARTVQKTSGQKVSTVQKQELLQKIEGLASNQTDLVLATELALPVAQENKTQVHRDESVTLTMSFTKEEFAELEKARALLSQSVPEGKWGSFVMHLLKMTKPKNQIVKPHERERLLIKVARKQSSSATQIASASEPGPRCQHKDPESGRLCGSKYFLQIDHIKSRWAVGPDETQNLQILCSAHNQSKYRKEALIKVASNRPFS